MADWTSIPNTTFEPGAPAKGRDARFLRDNPIAIAEGAPGAPRIVNAALASNSVTNAKVVNGELGAEKFQTGAAERDWVLARTAAASVGSVGTYGFFRTQLGGNVSQGDTRSGSSLRYSSTDNSAGVAGDDSPSGTWRAMGAIRGSDGSNQYATVFLRIS